MAFIALNQTWRYWRGMTVAPNGDVYICECMVTGGDIYKQTGGTGDFIALGQVSRNWYGIAAAPNGDIYICVNGGDIYKCTNGIGDFIALGQVSRKWFGMAAAPNGDIYACVGNGDIYKCTNGTGDFVALGQVSRFWYSVTISLNGDVFASVTSGDIYKQTGGTGDFISLNQGVKYWRELTTAPNGDIYICVNGGDIYKCTNGIGDFIALGQVSRNWYGIAAAPNGDIYAGTFGADIYIQYAPEIPVIPRYKILNIPIVGFKKESIPYTPENITSEDYHYSINSDIKINSNIESYTQSVCTGNFSNLPSISGKRLCMVNFSIDIYSMTDTTITPSYFDILESCGWKKINIDNGISIFPDSLYSRIPTTIEVSFPEEVDEPCQIVYKISGAMGNVKFIGETGKPIKAEFSFIGSLDKIYYRSFEDMITPENFDSANPNSLLNSEFELFNISNFSLHSFEISSNEIIDIFSNIMRHHGYDGTRIIDRITNGNLTLNSDAEIPSTLLERIENNYQGKFYLKSGDLYLTSENVKLSSINDELNKFNMEFQNGITLIQIGS